MGSVSLCARGRTAVLFFARSGVAIAVLKENGKGKRSFLFRASLLLFCTDRSLQLLENWNSEHTGWSFSLP